MHLHRLAQTHTPTSLESPLAPPPGMLTRGEDVHALLQEYALAAPSQRISLRMLAPPYGVSIKRLLQSQGYRPIIGPPDISNRAVLFWVDGFQTTTASVKQMLERDSKEKSLQWSVLSGKGSIREMSTLINALNNEVVGNQSAVAGDSEASPEKSALRRWIISFEDETEARRFVRLWHRKPFAMMPASENEFSGEPDPLVHAEILW